VGRGRAAAIAVGLLALGIASLAAADTVQQGGLRVTVRAQVQPNKLPRTGTAPIAVFIAGHIATREGSLPPQLEAMRIRVNRHGLLDRTGLAVCGAEEIAATSTQRALGRCAEALVGSGRFWAKIVLPDQRPYPTRGRLLVFNGAHGGRPAVLAHIYTTKPFASSFTVAFAIRRVSEGPYGTELRASFPEALGEWGFVDRIKLTLRRKFTFRGQRRSFFNAGCPAPKGTAGTVFPLAHASFYFADRKPIGLAIQKSCGVRE